MNINPNIMTIVHIVLTMKLLFFMTIGIFLSKFGNNFFFSYYSLPEDFFGEVAGFLF